MQECCCQKNVCGHCSNCEGNPLVLFTVETSNHLIDVPFGSVVRFLHDDSMRISLTAGSANLTFGTTTTQGPVNNYPMSVSIASDFPMTSGGAPPTVPFDNVIAGDSSQLLGTGEVEIREAGAYAINASTQLLIGNIIPWDPNSNDVAINLIIVVNDSMGAFSTGSQHQNFYQVNATGSFVFSDNAQVMLNLNAGDKVSLKYSMTSGLFPGAPTYNLYGDVAGQHLTYMNLVKV